MNLYIGILITVSRVCIILSLILVHLFIQSFLEEHLIVLLQLLKFTQEHVMHLLHLALPLLLHLLHIVHSLNILILSSVTALLPT